MKNVYLVLAIAGAVVPYVFFVEHFSAQGFALSEFIASAFATSVASGIGADLLISSTVFWILLFELKRRDGTRAPSPWPFIAVNLLIGLSCAIPAYLYIRSKGNEARAETSFAGSV